MKGFIVAFLMHDAGKLFVYHIARLTGQWESKARGIDVLLEFPYSEGLFDCLIFLQKNQE
jgi:hypothetical protein